MSRCGTSGTFGYYAVATNGHKVRRKIVPRSGTIDREKVKWGDRGIKCSSTEALSSRAIEIFDLKDMWASLKRLFCGITQCSEFSRFDPIAALIYALI